MMKPKSFKPFLIISGALNVFLIFAVIFSWVYNSLIGCSEVANGKMGILKKDIEIGHFGKNEKIFRLPKGLVVLDAHATGADYFEPYRFRIVVTSDDKDLVDYSSQEASRALNPHGNYHSVH